MLNEEQLLRLKTLKLTKTFHSTSKIEKILKCLEAAPNLTKLELDMNKHPHNRQLGLFIENSHLISLKLTNVELSGGFEFFEKLCMNQTLKKLSLHMSKFRAGL